ncbi:MAG: 3-methyl-2-oxobutanoate dehydrogenase [Bdellovibrionaceae bacterium]|nr:3-methyl-2-oxobutanoate dehydrogenase [Pseudobdellovibrionaceae bacterium]
MPNIESKTKTAPKQKGSKDLPLPKEKLLQIHNLMVKARSLEERLIKIYKAGDAFFWIGGPGEEAFGVTLGMLADKGKGHDHDWMHLHYRCTPTLIAMGMPMGDSIRLIMNKATDVSTGGRNFANHYSYPEWNVAPVTSPIEVQYSTAIGTAWAQRRAGGKGISVVTGGDAGTAEGDFASCLIWASRPGNELPLLITVQNNKWGISTNYDSQHGEKHTSDRGKAFNIRTEVINGNDPIESYLKLKEVMEYIRQEKKPVVLEAQLSRLYGHSSADGANRRDEPCCIELFEKRLIEWGLITRKECDDIKKAYDAEARAEMEAARNEPDPEADSIWDNVYVDNENGDWRKF